MSELTFNFRDSIQRVFITEDGKELFVGSEVCRNLGREENFARTIKTYVKSKWWVEYPNPNGGKPILCLYEPGVYQLSANPVFKSEWADEFQDFIFEDVLPKLRNQGLYINQIDGETLVQYEAREAYLLKVNREWQHIVFRNKTAKQLFSEFDVTCGYQFPPKGYRDFEKLLNERYGIYPGSHKCSNLFRFTQPIESKEVSYWFPRALVELIEVYRATNDGVFGDIAEQRIDKVKDYFGII